MFPVFLREHNFFKNKIIFFHLYLSKLTRALNHFVVFSFLSFFETREGMRKFPSLFFTEISFCDRALREESFCVLKIMNFYFLSKKKKIRTKTFHWSFSILLARDKNAHRTRWNKTWGKILKIFFRSFMGAMIVRK